MNRPYLPEGMNESYRANAAALATLADAQNCLRDKIPLEVIVQRCDRQHHLHATLGGCKAVIPRGEAISDAVSGAHKEIAVLSLVGKPVCCRVSAITADSTGQPLLELSRRNLQEEALAYLQNQLTEGSVLPAMVTSLSSIGAFADIGCGVTALLPLRQISVSRIRHPSERFLPRQAILAAALKIDRAQCRFLLTHKELLGTWQENAALFQEGETVQGIVRGVKSYGVFIELAPNLTGLAEAEDTLYHGERVSVLIKAILPEKHKIKLHIIDRLGPAGAPEPLHYFLRRGNIAGWHYFTE